MTPDTYGITGGCGFIGTHLTHKLLQAGHKVRILDDLSNGSAVGIPDSVEIQEASVTDFSATSRFLNGLDGVYHLAAITSVSACNDTLYQAHEVNSGGTVCLIAAMKDNKTSKPRPIVFASSAAIYGNPDQFPIAETTLARPISPYGIDKLNSEFHLDIASNLFQIPSIACRFFNVFGKGQPADSAYTGVITNFATRSAQGNDLIIHGDGTQVRDFVHVSDVVNALLASMTFMESKKESATDNFHALNICSGTGTSILDLAREVIRLSGNRIKTTHLDRKEGDINQSIGSYQKANTLIDFPPQTSLSEGLADLIHPAPSL